MKLFLMVLLVTCSFLAVEVVYEANAFRRPQAMTGKLTGCAPKKGCLIELLSKKNSAKIIPKEVGHLVLQSQGISLVQVQRHKFFRKNNKYFVLISGKWRLSSSKLQSMRKKNLQVILYPISA